MPTLLLSNTRLPAADALSTAARRRGWRCYALDRTPHPPDAADPVIYGGTDVVDEIAARFGVTLREPAFDLLARTPQTFRLRDVRFTRYDHLCPFDRPTFVKPADPRRKAFDAGIYRDVRDARLEGPLDPRMPVLVAEPVEWLEEHRCFILDGEIAASSPYLRFGRPVWRPFASGTPPALPEAVRVLCRHLLWTAELPFPAAFVVDVGLIDGRGWAVVEYNPAWCSSLLGADPNAVLPILQRASASGCDLGEANLPKVAAGAPAATTHLQPRRRERMFSSGRSDSLVTT